MQFFIFQFSLQISKFCKVLSMDNSCMYVNYMDDKYDIYIVYEGGITISYKSSGDLSEVINMQQEQEILEPQCVHFKEAEMIDLNKLKIKTFPRYFRAVMRPQTFMRRVLLLKIPLKLIVMLTQVCKYKKAYSMPEVPSLNLTQQEIEKAFGDAIPRFSQKVSKVRFQMQNAFSFQIYQPGTVFVKQEEVSDNFYILVHGEVECLRKETLGKVYSVNKQQDQKGLLFSNLQAIQGNNALIFGEESQVLKIKSPFTYQSKTLCAILVMKSKNYKTAFPLECQQQLEKLSWRKTSQLKQTQETQQDKVKLQIDTQKQLIISELNSHLINEYPLSSNQIRNSFQNFYIKKHKGSPKEVLTESSRMKKNQQLRTTQNSPNREFLGHLNQSDLFRLEKVRQTVYGNEQEVDIFDYPHFKEKKDYLNYNSNDIKKFSGLPRQKKSYFFQCKLNKSSFQSTSEQKDDSTKRDSTPIQKSIFNKSLFNIEETPQIFERKQVQSQLKHYSTKTPSELRQTSQNFSLKKEENTFLKMLSQKQQSFQVQTQKEKGRRNIRHTSMGFYGQSKKQSLQADSLMLL